jgi:hypothetical protein
VEGPVGLVTRLLLCLVKAAGAILPHGH